MIYFQNLFFNFHILPYRLLDYDQSIFTNKFWRNFFILKSITKLISITSESVLWNYFEATLASSSLYFSASLTIQLIYSLHSLPLLLVIVILLKPPVALSNAETFKIPLTSISNVTSIWGTSRGIGGIKLNLPNNYYHELMNVLFHKFE